MDCTIADIILILENALRMGAEIDDPEGVRYIQLSDTLAQKIISTLKNIQGGS
jgi:hypothetical protein